MSFHQFQLSKLHRLPRKHHRPKWLKKIWKKKLLSAIASIYWGFPKLLDFFIFCSLRHTAVDGKRQEVRSATSEMLAMPVVLKFLSSCVKKGSKWLWLCVNLRDHARGWWLAGPQREKKTNPCLCALGCILMFFRQIWFWYWTSLDSCYLLWLARCVAVACGIWQFIAVSKNMLLLLLLLFHWGVHTMFGHPVAIWKTPSPKETNLYIYNYIYIIIYI